MYWSQIGIFYSWVMEELVDLLFVEYYSYWFFSKVIWVVYIVLISILVGGIVLVDFSNLGV